MFIRISDKNCESHEWGYRVGSGPVPAVGDVVMMWYGLPDEEASDKVDGTVVKREWSFSEKETELWLTVTIEEQIPEGYIPDSREWPSSEASSREAALEESLSKIREEFTR